MPAGDAAGSFVGGLLQGKAQGREQKMQREYLDAQKGHVKAQAKALESQLEMDAMRMAILNAMSPEQRQATLFKTEDSLESKLATVLKFAAAQGKGQAQPLPDYVPGSGTGPTRPGAMSIPETVAQGQVGGGDFFGLTKEDLIRGVIKKEMGAEPTEYQSVRGVVLPGKSGPQTIRLPKTSAGSFPEYQASPALVQEFEAIYPEMASIRGTQGYQDAINEHMEMKMMQRSAPLGIDPKTGEAIIVKTAGKGAGTITRSPMPGGGQVIPITERAMSEGDVQALTSVSNLVEVLPDVNQMLQLRMKSGSSLTNPITGRVWQALLDRGVSTGVPEEAIKSHAALEHLKTWAMNVLRGAGSEGQRGQLQKTFPDLWDSPDIMRNKIMKTLQISRNVMDKRLATLRSSGKIVPPEFYADLRSVDDFLASVAAGKPKKKPDLSLGKGGAPKTWQDYKKAAGGQ